MAGSLIKTTGRTEFEDGSRIGIQSQVRNGLQISYTIPEVNLVGHMETGQNPLEADELLTS